MQTLKGIIALFQKEIAAALEAGTAGGVPGLEAERVTISLEVAIDETGPAGPADPAAGGARARIRVVPSDVAVARRGHTITMEFRVRNAPGDGRVTSTQEEAIPAGATLLPSAAAPEPGRDRARAVRELTAIFGPPGFDSSARASVFCEAMGGLTPEQAGAVPEALVIPAAEVQDENVRRVRHLIRGIVQSGPLKAPDRAAAILRELLRHWTVPALIQQIEDGWRTGDNWFR